MTTPEVNSGLSIFPLETLSPDQRNEIVSHLDPQSIQNFLQVNPEWVIPTLSCTNSVKNHICKLYPISNLSFRRRTSSKRKADKP